MTKPDITKDLYTRIDLAKLILEAQDRQRDFNVYGSVATLEEIEFILKQIMTEEKFAAALIAIRIIKSLESNEHY